MNEQKIILLQMIIYKRKIILSLILILSVSLSIFAQTEEEAKNTVEKFYKFYRTRNGQITTHELNMLKGWFTADLTNLFRNEIRREEEFTRKHPDEKPYFGDGFPFQPYEECVKGEEIILNRIEIGEVKITANKALVEVKFYIPKECESQVKEKLLEKYKIELVKNKTRWLINDWIYDDGKKLTNILKREKY